MKKNTSGITKTIKLKSVNNVDKDRKKQFFCWQEDTINGYKSLYLHWGPSAKENLAVQNKNLST